jgi:hypothetical protein
MQASVMFVVWCGLPAEVEVGTRCGQLAGRCKARESAAPRGRWFNGPGGFTPVGAILTTGAEPRTAASGRRVMQYRTLGRTGIKVWACPGAR